MNRKWFLWLMLVALAAGLAVTACRVQKAGAYELRAKGVAVASAAC